jgi:hypothetical protein
MAAFELTVKGSVELDGDVVEKIREIVREEIAAHEERLSGRPEVIALREEGKKALSAHLQSDQFKA